MKYAIKGARIFGATANPVIVVDRDGDGPEEESKTVFEEAGILFILKAVKGRGGGEARIVHSKLYARYSTVALLHGWLGVKVAETKIVDTAVVAASWPSLTEAGLKHKTNIDLLPCLIGAARAADINGSKAP